MIAVSQGVLKLTSMESVMPSNHLILCRPLLFLPSTFPSIRIFLMSQLFTTGGQSIGASASVLPVNIQDWFPLGWTGWISKLWEVVKDREAVHGPAEIDWATKQQRMTVRTKKGPYVGIQSFKDFLPNMSSSKDWGNLERLSAISLLMSHS